MKTFPGKAISLTDIYKKKKHNKIYLLRTKFNLRIILSPSASNRGDLVFQRNFLDANG